MSDFTSLSAMTNTAYTSATNNNADALAGKLKNTSSETTEEEMLNACKQFEAYFVEQVLKEVKKTVKIFGDDDEEDTGMSMYKDFFQDSYMQTISKQISDQGHLGLAQQLYESMKRNYNINITDEKQTDKADKTNAADDASLSENAAASGISGV